MSVIRIVVLGFVAQLAGCYVMKLPPSVPKVDRPTIAKDSFLELETGRANETRYYTENSKHCHKGDCIDVKTDRRKNVRVKVAAATLDGNPISIGQVAAAASPEYVSDTEKLRPLTSSCKRGRIVMMGGGVFLTAAYFLLQAGFRKDEPNRAAAIGGVAALGAGVTGMALGRFAFGGQHCNEAEKLYSKWATVYYSPDATTVKKGSAEMLELLVDKFNRDREAARARSADAEVEAAPIEE